MSQLKFGSAGVTSREIDLSGVTTQEPSGIPAGVIGTSTKGPAFVPVTVGNTSDFYAKFGKTDGKKFGPLAVAEWLRNAGSVTFLKVLGVGDSKQRVADGQLGGSVTSAGFVVGEKEPDTDNDGLLSSNPYANGGSNSVSGRTYFLGAFMSESAGSSVLSSPKLQTTSAAVPIIRGVLMAPSGVILRLSSSAEGTNSAPASTLVATDGGSNGSLFGSVVLLSTNSGNPPTSVSKQEFVMLLNGHKGTDSQYPNIISASFDMTAPNYFGNVFNTDPLKVQQAGHYLHANWDVHPSVAVVTGSGIVSPLSGAGASLAAKTGAESSAFLTTGSTSRNVGSAAVPNYELFADRFNEAKSPWIISQKFGGSPQNLFRLHALDSGAGVSTLYKVSIENIVPSSDPADPFGSFDVVIRDFNDRDTSQIPFERFSGCSLNPSSDKYVAKAIGDLHVYYDFDRIENAQKLVIEGNYQNQSNYVRVEVDSSVDSEAIDAEALPMGFRGIQHLVTSGSAPLTSPTSTQIAVSSVLKNSVTPPLPFRTNITIGSSTKISAEPRYYWGVQFEHVESLTTPNASTLANASIKSFAKYFPDFSTTNQNFVAGNNSGVVDTAANGIMDADRFCLNMFTLENVKVVTGSSGLADPAQWKNASYVRDGNIVANDTAKTRKLTTDDLIQANRRFAKFTFIVQGGFAGTNIFDNDETEINNAAVTADVDDSNRGLNVGPNVTAYTKAIDIMKNITDVDIQLLAIPGIRHPIVSNAGIDAVQERFDALYIVDLEQIDNDGNLVTSEDQVPSVELTVQNVRDRALDSSFAAAYFPDVVMTDPNTKTNVVVPPSVAVLGALAFNDAVGHPWFAPAGTTRGALGTTLEARVKLSKGDMDNMYDVNVNPLVAFPGNASIGTNPKGGVVIWGQKTLQVSASALDRVNVRRLLIDIRRQVREIAQTIIFEPNRESTLAKFSSAVTPRLQRIQSLNGLERFKVIIDASTTTQSDIENNAIRGIIMVQPSKSVEFVSLTFAVSNNIQEI